MGMGIMMRLAENQRQWLLLGIAIIFYAVGLTGIGLLHHKGIMNATPLHLLLISILLIVSFGSQLKRFSFWAIPVAITAFLAEWAGVHHGWLFGGYAYSGALGLRLDGIPLLIAANWVIVIAGSVSLLQLLRLPEWAVIGVAPLLATSHDFLLEPVAVSLKWWAWNGNLIPAYNYLCWYGLSVVFSALWMAFRVKGNLFAAGLFITQSVFFVLLQWLL